MAVPRRSASAQATLRLRTMTADDLPFVVPEHRRRFPYGFFARLGPSFLAAYYRSFLSAPHASAYVADLDGTPVAFLVGVTEPATHRRHVLRAHGRSLALHAAVAMLVRPTLAVHFVRTRLGRYARRLVRGVHAPTAGEAGSPAPPERVAALTRVAVVEEARGRSIGTLLTERFVADAAEAGCDRLTLVTDDGPDGASAYWAARGWDRDGETTTPEGRRLAVYARPVRPATVASHA